MPDDFTRSAVEIGKQQAARILEARARAGELRRRALAAHPAPSRATLVHQALRPGMPARAPVTIESAGTLVAEGDSWFDYPFHDVLKDLQDRHAYEVESVAHLGDPIEAMAYGGGQLEELARRLEKVVRHGTTPHAILLSGGGNDVAGKEFGMLLDHANSPTAGLNAAIADGVIGQRIRTAYVTILTTVSDLCERISGERVRILVHGYDYAIPDGRGFLGGWGPLPGPWLEPGFREKGFGALERRIPIVRDLIDRFNAMLATLPQVAGLEHVRHVDLRGTLSGDLRNYTDWWANELHPSPQGFQKVADRFAAALAP